MTWLLAASACFAKNMYLSSISVTTLGVSLDLPMMNTFSVDRLTHLDEVR